jgi:hypothetical protein
MTDASRLRLRSVRFKDGREIKVFRRDTRNYRADFLHCCKVVVDAQGEDLAGFALVVWGADLSSTSDCKVGQGSTIPSILVADFVRNRLLAQRIEDWTIERLEQK